MNPASAKNLRILVVDDFEFARQLLRVALNELGYVDVDEAEDGKVALARLHEASNSKRPFTMIFCDWSMPELTGLQLLNIVREDPSYRKLPFVMVTAEADQENVVSALSSGASDYIVKPIMRDVLKMKLEKIISRLPPEKVA